MTFLATIISRIFDPFIMFGASLLVLYWQSKQLIPVLIVCVVVPFVSFAIAWKTKVVSNWDVTDRKERPKLLWMLFVIEMIGVLIFHLTGLLPFLIMLLGFILITHVWKISGHTFAASTFSGMLIQTFGWAWWPILSIPVVVGWSRIYRKNHTPSQALAGALYAFASLFVIQLFSISA